MVSSLIPFGFLPVIAFLIVDAFAGYRRALWAALAAGAADVGFTWARAASPDWMGLGLFLVLAALVLASLRTGDSFYFKVHGALAEIASAAILLIAWYVFDRALLLDLTAAEMDLGKLAALEPSLTEDLVAEMLRLLSFQLPWWLLLHALFTFYAAVNWGKWAWALVRVPGMLAAIVLAGAFTQGAVVEELSQNLQKAAAAADSLKAAAADTLKAAAPADSLKPAPAATLADAVKIAPADSLPAPRADSLKAR
jgi:intracellular septation protein A